MRTPFSLILILLLVTLSAVAAPQEGAVEGTLDPQDACAQVSAVPAGAGAGTAAVDAKDGKFRLPLAAGTYTIVVSATTSSFPVRLENVVVRPGETTVLPTVLIVPGCGRAVLSGKVVPPLPDREVKLFAGNRERASARTDSQGRYRFTGLPAGEYEVRTSAPGHAQDLAPVTIPENQRVQQNMALLPVVAADGVDWANGKVRATGVGYPPQNGGSPAAARAMTQRAAIADGQRNLLKAVEQIKIDGQRSVKSLMATQNGTVRIQGYLKGYTVVSEQMKEDGRIEVILELPLTGPQGLSRFVE